MISHAEARRRLLRLRIALLRAASDVEQRIINHDTTSRTLARMSDPSVLPRSREWLTDDECAELRGHLDTIHEHACKVFELGPEPTAVGLPVVHEGDDRETMIAKLRAAHPQLPIADVEAVVDFTLEIASEKRS